MADDTTVTTPEVAYGDRVIFDPNYENISQLRYSDSVEDYANVAYIDSGEDKDTGERIIKIYDAVKTETGADAAGYERWELAMKAKLRSAAEAANDSDGNYATGDKPILDQGAVALKKHRRAMELSGQTDARATMFVWDMDYNMGDVVLIRSREWRLEKAGRVREVEEAWSSGVYTALITIGNPLPNISAKFRWLQAGIVRNANGFE